VFANVVLGDEINRASPKTQSALLEVMEEGTVTTDAAVYPVAQPFMVVATQNPVDMEGTYPLPEAQLDRFLLRISMGYPDAAAEAEILRTQLDHAPMAALRPVVSVHELQRAVEEVHRVEVAPAIESYVVSLARFTRDADDVELGVSPRGSLALLRAARAAAAATGRAYVIPEDVKGMAPLAWPHRMILLPEAAVQRRTTEEVVARALHQVPVPRALPT
jgi:MoxR-like ATPase